MHINYSAEACLTVSTGQMREEEKIQHELSSTSKFQWAKKQELHLAEKKKYR